MEIIRIFADSLYAAKYDGNSFDELEYLFDCWQDAEYLEDFFETHKEDLQNGFFSPIPSIEQAIILTRAEAKKLEEKLFDLANDSSLASFFKPLVDNEESIILAKQKGYGDRNKSWLRIYAIRIEDRYIITGGAIKLTKAMADREHTKDQLKRMDRCLAFLKELGIDSVEGFLELDLS